MKILHTADWHIGKQLHKHNLEQDNKLFLDWLVRLIKQRQINVLLVSGDIFDTTNPRNSSVALYYNFLKELIPLNCRVVITGGNHDAPSFLNAPRDILHLLNVAVVGSATENIEDELIVIKNERGEPVLQIAAVPYLREADLRKSTAGISYDDRLKQLGEGIKTHYQDLADWLLPNVPSIAMGHLYVRGVSTSDSERDIHAIGGEAAFTSDGFPKAFDYIALGHIHKPQRIADTDFIRYSGSPIPLSFSESADQKLVLELSLENGKLTAPTHIEVPRFRELKRCKGTIDEVWETLTSFTSSTHLPALVEVLVEEESYDPELQQRFNLIGSFFEQADFKIIKSMLIFKNRVAGTDELFAAGENIIDLNCRDVFEKRIAAEKISDESRRELMEAFDELFQEINEKEAI